MQLIQSGARESVKFAPAGGTWMHQGHLAQTYINSLNSIVFEGILLPRTPDGKDEQDVVKIHGVVIFST